MSEKYKKKCKYLNYVEHLLILAPTVASTATGCVSISAFALLVAILAGISSSAVGIKICAIIVEIKNWKLIRKKRKKKKHDKIVL